MIKNNRGFTLLELVVTICLIAIVVFFTVTGIYEAVPGISLKSAANELVSDMRLARSLAVKHQDIVSVEFKPVEGSYQISSKAEVFKTVYLDDARGGIKFGTGKATIDATTTDPKSFSDDFDFISLTGNKVAFSPNGTNNLYGYIYICNENNDISYAAGLSSLAGVLTFRKTIGPDEWITL